MNSRQAKKKRKYKMLSHLTQARFGIVPKGWSEIRWTTERIKYPKGLESVSKGEQ